MSTQTPHAHKPPEVQEIEVPIGRRERKKAQTRQSLVDAAQSLFLERGYDDVTVAEIAEAADTAVTTLFKHFPDGKGALIFGDAPDDHERMRSLRATVSGTGSIVNAIDALRKFFRGRGLFDEGLKRDDRQQALVNLIEATPVLVDYARKRWEECEDDLVAALLIEAGFAHERPDIRALARFVLQVPDLASHDPKPRQALDQIFEKLAQGWSD